MRPGSLTGRCSGRCRDRAGYVKWRSLHLHRASRPRPLRTSAKGTRRPLASMPRPSARTPSEPGTLRQRLSAAWISPASWVCQPSPTPSFNAGPCGFQNGLAVLSLVERCLANECPKQVFFRREPAPSSSKRTRAGSPCASLINYDCKRQLDAHDTQAYTMWSCTIFSVALASITS
jgi:hypothetical protein